jgi:murein DD-endopeptidase MepM/ murein hydrolase activator NlpD
MPDLQWYRTAALLIGVTVVLAIPAAGTVSVAAPAPAPTLQVSTVTLAQGRTAWVTIATPRTPAAPPIVRFAGRAWPVYAAGAGWRTLIAVDATARPGRYAVAVDLTYDDAARATLARTVRVERVAFPQRRLTFSPDRQALLTPEQVAYERRRVTAAMRVLHPAQLWDGIFGRPVDAPVSSPYGVLSIYQGVVRGFHGGADFAAGEGTPVQAVAAGIVRLAEKLPLSGNAVMIDHGLGVVTSYLHLSEIEAQVGQRVATGDVIGKVGMTGLATGPHLHLGLRVHGVRVDPLPWLAP